MCPGRRGAARRRRRDSGPRGCSSADRGRGLVGHHIHLEPAGSQLRQDLGRVAVQSYRKRLTFGLRVRRELQRMLEVVRPHVEIPMLKPPCDALVVSLHADGDSAVQRHCERLCAAHPAKTGSDRDGSGQRSSESLASHRREGLVGALQDSLGADVDPRAGRHLAVHGQPERLEPAKLIPGGPFRDEHGVGDEHPGRPLMRVEYAHRLARLDQQRLVAAEFLQLADYRVERLPGARRAAGPAVYDKILGTLGHRGVEVVHEHPHGGLLRPPLAGHLRAPGRVNGAAHLSRPTTFSAASTTAPVRIRAAAAASSGETTRSGPGPLTSRLSRVRTAAVPGAGLRGARRSSARADASSSTARIWVRLSMTERSLSAAPQPIDTWSSCMPEVGIESTLAGAASRRFSATSAAAVYWATIIPELTPGSSARNGGRPCERCGSSRRSTRRSAIDPISAAAIARKSAAKASGSPWKLPLDSTSPLSRTIGLSMVDDSSTSAMRRAKSRVSRAAPATWGLQRTE